ncbi:MAG: pantetheine-phosphate adenylyltransferase [Lachnospiraceae bacterium]|nr:pantetheine-phosphate adenylyltransferase [Lachnospiraceae bacterium]MBP5184755.1 pantetheine-phosphate adenylyltransferase [Lachnospiraceae bacterium]
MLKIAVYPGSFDPITCGHLDVIKRASKIVDLLIIGVLNNSSKNALFTPEERVELIERVVKDIPNVRVDSFSGLTVDFAKANGATVLVRGLRAVTDFEYELQIAQTNHKLNPDIDTIFFTTSVEYSYLSSSIAKEVASFGGSVHDLLPEEIIDTVTKKLESKRS